MIIESEFSRHASDSLDAWSWYGTFAGAEAHISLDRVSSKAPWFEHRRDGAEHEWWFGRLHVQWTPWGWEKHPVVLARRAAEEQRLQMEEEAEAAVQA